MRKCLKQTGIGEQVVELSRMCGAALLLQTGQSQADEDGARQSIETTVGRLERSISVIADRQQATLLDVVPFDVRKTMQTLGYVRSDMTLLGDCDDAVKAVDNMIGRVREIEALSQHIEGCAETQRELYRKMMEGYCSKRYAHDCWKFVRQVRKDVKEAAKSGKSALDILKGMLREMRQTRLDSYMSPAVKRLYESAVNADCQTYTAIVRGRRELTEDDIMDFFSFLYRYTLLKNHLDSITLLKPVKGDYEKLFSSWAAKKYVTLLSPVLLTLGGIQEKGHFAILLMVMRDLGLSPKENTPYVQMRNYVNEINKADDALRFGKDNSIFSKIIGQQGNTPFCELPLGEAGDSRFEVEKLKEYQTVYHRCLTILNYFGLRRTEEVKMAAYLRESNPAVEALCDYMTLYPEGKIARLRFLCSVLRRETLVFG